MSDPTVTAQPAAPAAQPDPNAFQLHGPQPRVMRLSRKALAVVCVAAGLGIGGSLIYALRPPSDRQAQELYNTDSRTTAETITSGPRDYAQAPRLGPPLPGDLGRPIVSAQQRGEDVPVPPIGAQPGPPDPRAQAEALRHGIDISSYRARQVAGADFTRFTHIFALDSSNFGDLRQIAPGDARASLSLLMDMVPGREGTSVKDPYFGGPEGFEETWADVSAAALALVQRLR